MHVERVARAGVQRKHPNLAGNAPTGNACFKPSESVKQTEARTERQFFAVDGANKDQRQLRKARNPRQRRNNLSGLLSRKRVCLEEARLNLPGVSLLREDLS